VGVSGGRNVVAVTTALLLVPAVGVGVALSDPGTPYGVLVALAVAQGHRVGVDVEDARRVVREDVAGRFFAPSEVADLRALPDAAQARVFFDYWTLKEAYIKARGMGLAIPLGDFAVALRPPAAPTIAFVDGFDDDAARWQFRQAWPTPDHRLGLAIERTGNDLDVRLRTLTPEALVP
jgi:4'-phosphopantetheinyl transferase